MGESVSINDHNVVKRNPLGVLGLAIITGGVYALWWCWRASEDLRRVAHDNTISPSRSLLAWFPGVRTGPDSSSTSGGVCKGPDHRHAGRWIGDRFSRSIRAVWLVLLFVVLVACTSSESGPGPRALSSGEAAGLAEALESGTPESLEDALEPGVRAELTRPVLPAGSSVTIEASTFTSTGDGLGTVMANVVGPDGGSYLVYLIRRGDRWTIYAAEGTR